MKKNDSTRIVAISPIKQQNKQNTKELASLRIYTRTNTNELVCNTVCFQPFMWLKDANVLDQLNLKYVHKEILKGDLPIKHLVCFNNIPEYEQAIDIIKKNSKKNKTIAEAFPTLLALKDPIEQFLASTNTFLFTDLPFENLKRLQVDIETVVSPGFEFSNPERDGDRIALIALTDSTGWEKILFDEQENEKKLLEDFVKIIKERDPDVIEGYNLFSFDLPYITARAKKLGVKLTLGRDGSEISSHPSRFMAAERTISFEKFQIEGRHIVDIYFLILIYDLAHRTLEGHSLKEAAIHFKVASKDRTYLPGEKISETIAKNPELVIKYALDDVKETRALSELLSRTYFAQAQMLPMDYQNTCLRGNAVKVETLLLKEYLHQKHSLPEPDTQKTFAGGYTDVFVKGVIQNIHHCDVRSLYPSIMLANKIAPSNDKLNVFLSLLEQFTKFRLEAKKKLSKAKSHEEKLNIEATQSAFKILINSFYGYLAFPQARFADFSAAEKITEEGRRIVKHIINWLKQNGAIPVEADTDGIYYVPPSFNNQVDYEKFKANLQASLPQGITLEFDGEYEAIFSYKMKNYALLTKDGEVIIKGAALKSRGLEMYLREFMRDYLFLKLTNKENEIEPLFQKYKTAIEDHKIDIHKLAKTETLNESLAAYSSKITKSARGRNAAYELALKSKLNYQPGDRISYYITGNKPKVTAFQNAKLITEWDPNNRDENTAYYIAKLEALVNRLQKGETELDENEPESENLFS